MVRINGFFHLLVHGVHWGCTPFYEHWNPNQPNGTSKYCELFGGSLAKTFSEFPGMEQSEKIDVFFGQAAKFLRHSVAKMSDARCP